MSERALADGEHHWRTVLINCMPYPLEYGRDRGVFWAEVTIDDLPIRYERGVDPDEHDQVGLVIACATKTAEVWLNAKPVAS